MIGTKEKVVFFFTFEVVDNSQLHISSSFGIQYLSALFCLRLLKVFFSWVLQIYFLLLQICTSNLKYKENALELLYCDARSYKIALCRPNLRSACILVMKYCCQSLTAPLFK